MEKALKDCKLFFEEFLLLERSVDQLCQRLRSMIHSVNYKRKAEYIVLLQLFAKDVEEVLTLYGRMCARILEKYSDIVKENTKLSQFYMEYNNNVDVKEGVTNSASCSECNGISETACELNSVVRSTLDEMHFWEVKRISIFFLVTQNKFPPQDIIIRLGSTELNGVVSFTENKAKLHASIPQGSTVESQTPSGLLNKLKRLGYTSSVSDPWNCVFLVKENRTLRDLRQQVISDIVSAAVTYLRKTIPDIGVYEVLFGKSSIRIETDKSQEVFLSEFPVFAHSLFEVEQPDRDIVLEQDYGDLHGINGSRGCFLKTDDGEYYMLTAQHVVESSIADVHAIHLCSDCNEHEHHFCLHDAALVRLVDSDHVNVPKLGGSSGEFDPSLEDVKLNATRSTQRLQSIQEHEVYVDFVQEKKGENSKENETSDDDPSDESNDGSEEDDDACKFWLDGSSSRVVHFNHVHKHEGFLKLSLLEADVPLTCKGDSGSVIFMASLNENKNIPFSLHIGRNGKHSVSIPYHYLKLKFEKKLGKSLSFL